MILIKLEEQIKKLKIQKEFLIILGLDYHNDNFLTNNFIINRIEKRAKQIANLLGQ